MGGYRFHEHTADIIVEAWGNTLEEMFEEAAKGVSEVMTDIRKVEPKIKKQIVVTGMDLQNLLLRWLEELLILHDSEGLVFSEFHVKKIEEKNEEYKLEAIVGGEKFDKNKHESRTHVKAITYAQMEIKKEKDAWRAFFTLDI